MVSTRLPWPEAPRRALATRLRAEPFTPSSPAPSLPRSLGLGNVIGSVTLCPFTGATREGTRAPYKVKTILSSSPAVPEKKSAPGTREGPEALSTEGASEAVRGKHLPPVILHRFRLVPDLSIGEKTASGPERVAVVLVALA